MLLPIPDSAEPWNSVYLTPPAFGAAVANDTFTGVGKSSFTVVSSRNRVYRLFLLLALLQLSPISSPFAYLHPALLPLAFIPLLCIHQLCIYVLWLISLPSFISPTPFPLRSISLFDVSMSLVLLCLSFYVVHYIRHVSEIVWCLSFFDWLILLSMIISRSIIVKGKGSFFFTAA